jgi:IS1 family transposase
MAFHDAKVVGVKAKRVQVDEIWSFTYAKAKNVPKAKKAPEGAGDTWTWTAIDADEKLIVQWYVGDRDGETAKHFIDGVAARMAGRVQLTSDGLKTYLEAVEGAFGADVDFAQLIKIYGPAPETGRYSPPECIGTQTRIIEGSSDEAHICTRYVERSNLSMRMQMRRFTRLTNAFLKKLERHICAVSLYLVFDNWMRIQITLRVTPAMVAVLTDKLMSMEDLVVLIDAAADKPNRPASYKKRSAENSN